MIDKMMDEPLDDDSRLVLFNALYMEGKWEKTFEKENTMEEEFHVNPVEVINVSMMNKYSEYFYCFENDMLEGCLLPYKDCSLEFIALKPKSIDTSIRNVLDGLSADELLELIQNGQERMINLKLPSFEIAYEKSLNDSLCKLGLTDAFNSDSENLVKIGSSKTGYPIYVSLVYQKAKVKVDEEGTQAAAVTEILCAAGSACIELEEVYDLYFNQPFFYMIMDTENQIPVFMGIMDRP